MSSGVSRAAAAVTGVAARSRSAATNQLGSARRISRAPGVDTEAAARLSRLTSSCARFGVSATAPIRTATPATPLSIRRRSLLACLPPNFPASDHSSGRAERPPPITSCHTTTSPRRSPLRPPRSFGWPPPRPSLPGPPGWQLDCLAALLRLQVLDCFDSQTRHRRPQLRDEVGARFLRQLQPKRYAGRHQRCSDVPHSSAACRCPSAWSCAWRAAALATPRPGGHRVRPAAPRAAAAPPHAAGHRATWPGACLPPQHAHRIRPMTGIRPCFWT